MNPSANLLAAVIGLGSFAFAFGISYIYIPEARNTSAAKVAAWLTRTLVAAGVASLALHIYLLFDKLDIAGDLSRDIPTVASDLIATLYYPFVILAAAAVVYFLGPEPEENLGEE